jgi:hypothetical protein
MRSITYILLFALCTAVTRAQLSAGTRLVYQVSEQSTSTFWSGALQQALSGQGEASPDANSEITSKHKYRYQLRQTALNSSGTLFMVEWSREQIDDWQINGQSVQKHQALLKAFRSLSPVYVRLQGLGELEFACPKELPAEMQSAVGNILYPLQFVRNPKNREYWETEEAHPVGKIRCRYRLVKRDRKQAIYNKAVAEVILSHEEKQLGKTHRILGYLQYTLDSQGTIVRVTGTLRQRIAFAGTPVSHTDKTLDVRLVTCVRVPARQLDSLQRRANRILTASQWRPLYTPPTEQEHEQMRAQSLLQGETPESLLEQLDHMLSMSPDGESAQQQRFRLQSKLESALFLYGEGFVQAVVDRFRQRLTTDDGFWLLLGALCHSNRLEAQAALLAVLREPSSIEQQHAIVRQLVLIEKPRREFLHGLWEFAREQPSGELQIRLGLAVSALVSKSSEHLLAAEIAKWCLQQLQQAEDPTVWLSMLGNLRHKETLPDLERYARVGNAQTRLAAIKSMSRFEAKDVLPIWVRLYEIDQSQASRQAMVEQAALWWHHPLARQLLERAAFSDPDIAVRKAVVHALATIAVRDSDALNTLVRIAEANSSPAIRREAMISLAALHAEGIKIPPVRAAP